MSKQKRAYHLMIDHRVEIPWQVARFLNSKQIRIYGDSASITTEGDTGSVKDLRQVIEWLADQFGGSVKWEEKS